MTTENWIDLNDIQAVAIAQSEGWEIECRMARREDAAWETWTEGWWEESYLFRGRPRQPKMKEVKMECWLIDGRLDWRDWNEPTQGSRWVRQPHLDMVAKVPE